MIEAAEANATLQHDTPSVSAKPRLLDQMRQVIRVKHYSMRTEKTYLSWVKQFIRWSGMRHPSDMGAPEIEAFLSMLANQRDVAASTQNQALAALLFLYKQVLGVDLPWLDGITRAKKPARLPVVLSQAEVVAVLGHTSGVNGLIIRMLYGTGMRLMEGLRLRVKDIEFDSNIILVRDGKGGKDRVVPLPATLAQPLRNQLATRRKCTTWISPAAWSTLMIYCCDQMRIDALMQGGDVAIGQRAAIAAGRLRIAATQAKLDRITKALATDDGAIPITLLREMRTLEESLITEREAIEALERELSSYRPAATPDMAQRWLTLIDGVESLDTDARLEARELVRASFTRITVWLAGNPATPGGGFLDMEITARSGGVQRLRVDRASGRLLG